MGRTQHRRTLECLEWDRVAVQPHFMDVVRCLDINFSEVDRLDDIDFETFQREYAGIKPFVLVNGTSSWIANEKWHPSKLGSTHGQAKLEMPGAAGGKPVGIALFMRLFNRENWRNRMRGFIEGSIIERYSLDTEYEAPPALRTDDLFHGFRAIAKARGFERFMFGYKWFVIGFPGSGTTFHKDYWDTPFWNACLYGRKRWVILDPNTPKELTDIYEQMDAYDWFNSLYHDMRIMPNMTWWQFYQEPGDIVYSPGGYFHNTINTGPSITVSENLIPLAVSPLPLRPFPLQPPLPIARAAERASHLQRDL